MTARRPSAALGALVLATVVTLAGCSSADDASAEAETASATGSAQEAPSTTTAGATDADTLLAAYGLDGLDARELIERLDTTALADRPADLMASIRPNEVVVATAEGEAAVPMPTDEFYLSIAPYVSQTHECYFHSLTTCVGELQNASIDVTITDADTGEVLVDGAETTYDNGFVGFWVPSGINAEVTIEHEGRSATEVLPTTSTDDRTCVTTLQLT